MSRLFLFTVLFASLLSLLSQNVLFGQASDEASHKITNSGLQLKLNVTNFKSSDGQLMAQLYNESGEVVENLVQPMQSEKKQLCMFKNLAPGKYAIRIFHDQNSNGKLDTNLLGIPKERFGFSNNVMGKYGPPDFEEQLFELQSNGEITINLLGR